MLSKPPSPQPWHPNVHTWTLQEPGTPWFSWPKSRQMPFSLVQLKQGWNFSKGSLLEKRRENKARNKDYKNKETEWMVRVKELTPGTWSGPGVLMLTCPPLLPQHLSSALSWCFPLCIVVPSLLYICLSILAASRSRPPLALLCSAPMPSTVLGKEEKHHR